ncbi:K(+) efflux antiporter 1, chloroplastic-like [Capsicum annuum]|uniref:K(+) efflux antiporter 1, chloroplastic-like n=1 Tax=Capsicum annuum TaxID=4072 RepID=UPI001FB0FE4C|nr:K(+) efflux antiporter 1, chloroplastic-like [Capsicum annuum]
MEVLLTTVMVGLVANLVARQDGPSVIVIGNGLTLSYSAVVLQERGKSTSRYGRATFSVLLFQDLVVVVLLILIPLISPNSSKTGFLLYEVSFQAIAEALSLAAVKAVVDITTIIAGGHLVGMSIDPKLLLSNFPVFMGSLGLLLFGKTILVALVHKLFGISTVSTIRVGLLLAPGGEFAFVAFGEAVNQGIMSPELSSLLFLVPTDEASGSISPMDARRSRDDSDPNDSH